MPDLDYESEYSLNTEKLLKEGIPAAYLMTNDVDAMSNWLNANSKKLSPQAKSILEARIGSAKYFKDLRNSKSTNKKLPDSRTDLYVDKGKYILKNIHLASNQTSASGCGSTVLEMMLKSRGLNVAQEHIRSFRSNKDVNEIVNENYELDPKAQNENGRGKLSVTKNYNDDEYIDITSRADVITEHLPNTAMRSKEYSAITVNGVKKGKGTNDVVDERQLSNAILSDVRDAIGIHKSPVGLLVNNHYLTVVGVDVDNRELIFEDSLSTKKLQGQQMSVTVDDIVASIRTADNGGKEKGTIQISWVEDMHPDLDGNLQINGFSDQGFEYKNNQFVIPEKNDALIKNDYYVKNSYQLNKIGFGEGYYVDEKLILPKQLDKEEAYKKPNEVGIYREHNKEQFNILPHGFVPQENTLVPLKSEAKKDIEHLSLDQIKEHDPDVELSEINEYIPGIPIDVNAEFIDAKKKLDELNNEAIANALAENNQPISQPINNVPKEEIKPQPVKQQPIKKEEPKKEEIKKPEAIKKVPKEEIKEQPIKKEEPKKEAKAEPKKEVKAEPKKEEIKQQPAKKEKLNPQPAIQPKSQWFNASEEETDDLSKINMEGYMDEIIRLYNRTKGLESAEMNVTYAGFDKACRNIIALSETLKAQKPRFADAFYMYPKEAQKAIKDVLVSANNYLAEFNKRDSDKSMEELSDVQQERLKTMASINCLSAMVANQVRFNSPEGKQFRLATKITNAQCIIGAGLNYREDVLLKNTVSMSNPKSYLSLVYKLQKNPDFNEFTKGGVLTDKEMSKLSKTKGFDLMDKYGDFSRKMDKQREKERQNEPELML